MTEKLLQQGAEGRLYLTEYNGRQCLVKERFVKKYRHPTLDAQITKERIRAESKAIKRCSDAGILTPKLFNIDLDNRKIFMEYFERSITVKEYIINLPSLHTKEKLSHLCSKIGSIIALMHKNNIIHGDLTTSNILLNPINCDDFASYDVIMIDFGLSHYSQSVEDKAVDLYVLERALLSTHSNLPDIFEIILDVYISGDKTEFKEVVNKLEEVRARGRKRTMIG